VQYKSHCDEEQLELKGRNYKEKRWHYSNKSTNRASLKIYLDYKRDKLNLTKIRKTQRKSFDDPNLNHGSRAVIVREAGFKEQGGANWCLDDQCLHQPAAF